MQLVLEIAAKNGDVFINLVLSCLLNFCFLYEDDRYLVVQAYLSECDFEFSTNW